MGDVPCSHHPLVGLRGRPRPLPLISLNLRVDWPTKSLAEGSGRITILATWTKLQNVMARERIVIETTDQRKTALVEAISLQGETLSDWLEEQLTLALPASDTPHLPVANQLASVDALSNSSAILRLLKKQDWAFTDDDTRYLTHDLHPYPAKFIPQIPSHLIAALSVPGDVVFDPFGGSATTAVEAVRMGRRAVSMDANPLSEIIGRVKTGLLQPSTRAELDRLYAAVASYVASPYLRSANWPGKIAKKHRAFIPDIPNIDKWFAETSIAELSLIRFLIQETTSGLAHDAAQLALSRIVIRASYQESETRYVAEPKPIEIGSILRGYQESLKTVYRRLDHSAGQFQRTEARFVVGDSRTDISQKVGSASVDLIVTSPPYPNATDYHLYHRFRLFWLGFDPRSLGTIEIGSHLRHQRNGSGFEEYAADMSKALAGCFDALQPGRYAVFVVGDALFKGKIISTAESLGAAAKEAGFELVGVIDRPIHQTKRSFAAPARRARKEQLVVLRKPDSPTMVTINPPNYKMWPYEVVLRKLETEALVGAKVSSDYTKPIEIRANLRQLAALRRLAFSRDYKIDCSASALPTWQKVLENGDFDQAKRKDPKYVTHGIHAYKGKFYPQLAKALVNISGSASGATIMDPFCGSGTVPLEGMLNGFVTFGVDLNPLAAKIARAKTGILSGDRAVVEAALQSLSRILVTPPKRLPPTRDQFASGVQTELDGWFAPRVLDKLEWVLGQIRLFGDPTLVEYCEVVLSDIIRDVSQQDPTDLRIRRRKEPLVDAPVIELFKSRLDAQLERIVKYWSIAARQPAPIFPATIWQADCRKLESFRSVGLSSNSVDCVVTSPPYATALPYIDTDRLSLMAIMGITGSKRSTLEETLTGSREIRRRQKDTLEAQLYEAGAVQMPKAVLSALRQLHKANKAGNVGFRRDNMSALLLRYFLDMQANLRCVFDLLKPGSVAYYVVGDSRTKAGDEWTAIETCRHLSLIAKDVGFETSKLLDISVTTENFKHIKNAITENAVLTFRKPN